MINIYTDKTDILNLESKIMPTRENASRININYDELKAYSNWYYKNDNFYYFKKSCNNIEILNHLICEKVAEYFKVLTAHYIPAIADNSYGVASPNFRKPNISYQAASLDYFWVYVDVLTIFNTLEINSENNKTASKLINDLLKLISFHIYTELDDIHSYNVLFERNNKSLNLAPAFDYDYAFESKENLQSITYGSAICGFDIPSPDFEQLLTKYPYFKKYLNLFLTIDIKQILNALIDKWNLSVNELYIDHYKKQDEIKKEFIRSLHL